MRPHSRIALPSQDEAAPKKAVDAPQNRSGVPVPKLPEFDKEDTAKYGRQLADYADLYDTGWFDSYQSSTMTLIAANGDSVKRKSVQLILENQESATSRSSAS